MILCSIRNKGSSLFLSLWYVVSMFLNCGPLSASRSCKNVLTVKYQHIYLYHSLSKRYGAPNFYTFIEWCASVCVGGGVGWGEGVAIVPPNFLSARKIWTLLECWRTKFSTVQSVTLTPKSKSTHACQNIAILALIICCRAFIYEHRKYCLVCVIDWQYDIYFFYNELSLIYNMRGVSHDQGRL